MEDGITAQRDRFFAEAVQITGLSDFGIDDYSDGLAMFFDALDKEVVLTPSGRAMTHEQIVALLASRLYSEEGWKRRPDALAQPVKAPLVITGIVRSGTTALHKLLSVDPQFQGLEHWLARAPQPRPPREAWRDLPAYQRAAQLTDDIITGAPVMKTDHMMSSDEVEESIFLLPQTFTNNMFPSQWNIPTYDRWYRQQDETDSYVRFRKNLQLIGANDADKRWLLKNPTDLLAMDALLNAFPDAMIVQMHRDPLQSIPSVCNLLAAHRRMFEGENADVAAVGRRETDFWAEALERAWQARPRTQKPVLDIEFGDFIHDQLGTVKMIYRCFGLELQPEVEEMMVQWLDEHPRTSATLHRFSSEDFGVSEAALRNRFAAYRERQGYLG
jgi:hypothetical protein